MSFNKKFFATGGIVASSDAVCTTETTDKFGDGNGVALYSLDYDASTAQDAATDYSGTPTDVTFGVGGAIGNYGARFNGSSSKIIVRDIFSSSPTQCSVSVWVKADSWSSPSGNKNILDLGDPDTSLAQNRIFLSGTNKNIFVSINGGDGGFAQASQSFADGSWHHIVATYDVTGGGVTNGIKVYIDGSLADEGNSTESFNSLEDLAIGVNEDTSNRHFWEGDIDQVRIFSSILTSSQVSQLYAETACVHTSTTDIVNYPTGTTPVAYIPFDNSAEDLVSGDFGTLGSGTEFRFGRFGQAIVSNQNTTSATFPNISETANSPFSVSCWVNIADRNSTNYFFLWETGQGSSSVRVGLVSGQSGKYYVNFCNNELFSSSSVVPPLNQWFHFVLTYDGTNVKVYSDTEKVIDGDINTNSLGSGNTFRVLYNASSSEAKIDQVRVYSTALNASRVSELYNEKPETDTSNFKTVLYEGTGSTQYISNIGYDLDVDNGGDGGMLWIKERTSSSSHRIVDSVRGDKNRIFTNNDGAESSVTEGETLEANGFFIGQDNGSNQNNQDYVAWVWKGGGDDVLNEEGTIDSQVSANTEAGFSVVKWTGDNSTATIGHGLNSAPEVVIRKNLGGTSNWAFDTTVIDGSFDYLFLDTTAAKSNHTSLSAPTSTVFSTGGTSFNSSSMIAYCWHSVAGYSKIGTYDGTGSSSDNRIYTTNDGLSTGSGGFKPSWIMIKNVDSAFGWGIVDNRRLNSSDDVRTLFANTNGIEADISGHFDFNDDGFTIRNYGASWANHINGNTYIYMAFK